MAAVALLLAWLFWRLFTYGLPKCVEAIHEGVAGGISLTAVYLGIFAGLLWITAKANTWLPKMLEAMPRKLLRAIGSAPLGAFWAAACALVYFYL